MTKHVTIGTSNRSNWLAAIVCSAIAGLLGTNSASAQEYGGDYLSFRGEGVVLDNPTTTQCQSIGINFNTNFFVIYRFAAIPALIADALYFVSGNNSSFRIVSTQSPGFSLNGTSTFNSTTVSRLGDLTTGSGSSTITILAGSNAAVTTATGNIKIVNGHITSFFNISGCDITDFHGAAVAIPE